MAAEVRMLKKRVILRSAVFFLAVALLGLAIFSVAVIAPDLVCTYKNTPCITDPPGQAETKVLGASNFTNAHAENSSQNNYGWNVCCKIQGIVTSNNCRGADTNVTGLNSSDAQTNYTNAHVESPFWAISNRIPSPTNTCLSANPGTTLCFTENRTVASLNPNQICLFTQSNITNAHVGNCTGPDTYGWVNWCMYDSQTCGGQEQNCCNGLCQYRLSCQNNVCLPLTFVGECGNGVPDPSETCLNCPQDVGPCSSSSNATVFGYVRNSTGIPISGARVEALKKNFTFTNAQGYYELKFGNTSESPYDLVASASGFESQTVLGYAVFSGTGSQKDFTVTVYRGDCTDNCKKVGSNLCSKDCQGKGFCWFYSQATMEACDGTFGWTGMPNGQSLNCCKGRPYSPLKADPSVPCASNVIKTQKIVLYLGKLVMLNTLMFVPDLCPAR